MGKIFATGLNGITTGIRLRWTGCDDVVAMKTKKDVRPPDPNVLSLGPISGAQTI